MLAVRTNEYANAKRRHGKNRDWHDTTGIELQAFHSLFIFMSEYKCEAGLKGYWGDHGRTFECPFVTETMSFHRFQQLRQNLHVVSESDLSADADVRDPTMKTKLWYDMLNDRVLAVWSPTEFVVLDESCIRVCGRTCMRKVTLPFF